MRTTGLAIAVTLFLVPFGVGAGTDAQSELPTSIWQDAQIVEAPSPRERLERLRLSQSYSARCVTAYEICLLPTPEPVGALCYCGEDPGTVEY